MAPIDSRAESYLRPISGYGDSEVDAEDVEALARVFGTSSNSSVVLPSSPHVPKSTYCRSFAPEPYGKVAYLLHILSC